MTDDRETYRLRVPATAIKLAPQHWAFGYEQVGGQEVVSFVFHDARAGWFEMRLPVVGAVDLADALTSMVEKLDVLRAAHATRNTKGDSENE
jgi:hypothetical protein